MKEVSCGQCGGNFPDTKLLSIHMKYVHKRPLLHHCDICGIAFPDELHLITHKKSHTSEKPFKCDLCDRTFSYSMGLVYHKRFHDNENMKKYESFSCKKCKRSYANKGVHYQNHIKNCTAVVLENPDTQDEIIIDAVYSEENLNLKPKIAAEPKRTFPAETSDYLQTIQKLSTDDKPLSDKSEAGRYIECYEGRGTEHLDFQGKDIQQRTSEVENKVAISCDICSNHFSEPEIEGHRIQCRDKYNKFPCAICGKSCSDDETLQIKTLDEAHKEKIEYYCKTCCNNFSPQDKSKNRYDFSLVKKKPVYKCEICHKRFISTQHLILHRKVHSVERPYNCKVCKDSFENNFQLVQHQRVHLFSCDICDKKFASIKSLTCHKKYGKCTDPRNSNVGNINFGIKQSTTSQTHQLLIHNNLIQEKDSDVVINNFVDMAENVTDNHSMIDREADIKEEIKIETTEEDPIAMREVDPIAVTEQEKEIVEGQSFIVFHEI